MSSSSARSMDRSAQVEGAQPAGLRLLALPLAFTTVLAAFTALPSVRANDTLLWSLGLTAAALAAWNAALFFTARRAGRSLAARLVVRRPHWMQPLVQLSVYVYWATQWPQVLQSAHLIVAQIFFAYAFDLLLAWTLEDTVELGFGVLPIILSTNLFLWFKPDWFYLQFVLVAVGFAAKRVLRWTKNGRRAHIFNPSSFPLAIASIGLLLTGMTRITWGEEIAQTISRPSHFYELLFLVSLPGQLLFGVASMTMPAVLTTVALAGLFHLATGTFFFFGAVPLAAFLGMLLLFTDPSTAPESELGRVLYGMLYGASVFVLYGLLDLSGDPTFYDKLLFVPALNLAVRALDRAARSPRLAWLDPAKRLASLRGRARNAGWTAAWATAFAALLVAGALGDSHPASFLPAWRTACAEGRFQACRRLDVLEDTVCDHGSAWACNEVGARVFDSPVQPPEEQLLRGAKSLDRACALGFAAGCVNARGAQTGRGAMAHAAPSIADYPYLLDTKRMAHPLSAQALFRQACNEGWKEGCEALAQISMDTGSR